MGSAMMIGVAQVMGMKPTLRSRFSGGPSLSWASALAAASGKTEASAAAAVPAPTCLRKSRRPENTASRSERSTRLSRLPAGLVIAGLLGPNTQKGAIEAPLPWARPAYPGQLRREESKAYAANRVQRNQRLARGVPVRVR